MSQAVQELHDALNIAGDAVERDASGKATIIASECADCQKRVFPPTDICPECLSENMTRLPLSRRGRFTAGLWSMRHPRVGACPMWRPMWTCPRASGCSRTWSMWIPATLLWIWTLRFAWRPWARMMPVRRWKAIPLCQLRRERPDARGCDYWRRAGSLRQVP